MSPWSIDIHLRIWDVGRNAWRKRRVDERPENDINAWLQLEHEVQAIRESCDRLTRLAQINVALLREREES